MSLFQTDDKVKKSALLFKQASTGIKKATKWAKELRSQNQKNSVGPDGKFQGDYLEHSASIKHVESNEELREELDTPQTRVESIEKEVFDSSAQIEKLPPLKNNSRSSSQLSVTRFEEIKSKKIKYNSLEPYKMFDDSSSTFVAPPPKPILIKDSSGQKKPARRKRSKRRRRKSHKPRKKKLEDLEEIVERPPPPRISYNKKTILESPAPPVQKQKPIFVEKEEEPFERQESDSKTRFMKFKEMISEGSGRSLQALGKASGNLKEMVLMSSSKLMKKTSMSAPNPAQSESIELVEKKKLL
eukprot:augustus_masked-scaffold_5-processed-gene-19.53-mRNA-1 protein AED:1.00 eAED:1.00 QI:0/-1/0/0/-1/1/1/0/299